MLLLPDGSVMVQNVYAGWHRLTPDAAGNYTDGTWTGVSSREGFNGTVANRLFYASAVLPSDQVFFSGGEYNNNPNNFSPVEQTNTDMFSLNAAIPWATLNLPTYNSQAWPGIGDSPCKLLPNGDILLGYNDTNNNGLVAPNATAEFNPSTSAWTQTASKLNFSSTEESWVLLPDGTVLTVNCDGRQNTGQQAQNTAEKYIPSLNEWIADATPPVQLVDPNTDEIGPALLLPNGKVFYVGATGNTAIYTPASSPTAQGSWATGPKLPSVLINGVQTQLTAEDAPACLEPSGKVLLSIGPQVGTANQSLPEYFYEYDPTAQTYTQITGGPSYSNPFDYTAYGRFLVLPNGQILFAYGNGEGNDPNLYFYTPAGSPNSAWAPTVQSVTKITIGDQTGYKITGTQLTGLSEAVAYGDEASQSTNYPIVYFKDIDNEEGYATTLDWTPAVATGSSTVTAEFTLPFNLKTNGFTIYVIANGISSNAFQVSPH